MCNIVKTHLESKSQRGQKSRNLLPNCVQYSKNTFRKQITTNNGLQVTLYHCVQYSKNTFRKQITTGNVTVSVVDALCAI